MRDVPVWAQTDCGVGQGQKKLWIGKRFPIGGGLRHLCCVFSFPFLSLYRFEFFSSVGEGKERGEEMKKKVDSRVRALIENGVRVSGVGEGPGRIRPFS